MQATVPSTARSAFTTISLMTAVSSATGHCSMTTSANLDPLRTVMSLSPTPIAIDALRNSSWWLLQDFALQSPSRTASTDTQTPITSQNARPVLQAPLLQMDYPARLPSSSRTVSGKVKIPASDARTATVSTQQRRPALSTLSRAA